MKAQGAMLQGALAVAGLTAAYFAWQKAPDAGATDVTVLDVSKASLASVTYDDNKQHVVVTRGEEGGDPVTWFTVLPKDPPPLALLAKDGGTADGGIALAAAGADAGIVPAAAAASAPKKAREFRGNDLSDKLWDRFSPLRGTRALGVLDAAKLKEVGLDKVDRSLTIEAGGTTYDFEIGTVAQGVVNPYFRNRKDGKVYLVKGTLLSDLEFAQSRLVDRRLHAFKPEEFDALRVKEGDATREYVVSDGKLAPKAAPSSPDTFAKNWSDKVYRLVVTEVLGKDESPPGGAPDSELRVDYLNKGKLVGWIEVGHSGSDVFARTEHTAGWMKLPANSGDVLLEGKKVASGS